MIYSTSGGFIQALKDYERKKAKAEQYKKRYQDLYYERYQKVRSPLDYDIVGYKKNKKGEIEAIRQIKIGGSYNENAVSDYHEVLDEEIDSLLDKYSKLAVELENTRLDLKQIAEPLRSILIMRFVHHRKLKDVCQNIDLVMDESGLYKFIQRELKRYYEE